MKKEELPTAEEMCKRDGTKQCAALCLQYSCLIPLGECPATEIVWTDEATRNHLKRKSRNLPAAARVSAMTEASRNREYWQSIGVTPMDLSRELGCQPTWAAIERTIRRWVVLGIVK
jgi:hypothetical protein